MHVSGGSHPFARTGRMPRLVSVTRLAIGNIALPSIAVAEASSMAVHLAPRRAAGAADATPMT
jgi:hypothetical protein